MRTTGRFLGFAALLLATSLSFVAAESPQNPAVAPASAADSDYAAFEALRSQLPPGSRNEMGAEKYMRWLDEHWQKLSEVGLGFYSAHPADSRRWNVVLAMVLRPPRFVKSVGPDVEERGAAAVVFDEAAVAAWTENIEKLKQALIASTDAGSDVREKIEWLMLMDDFRAATTAVKGKAEPFDGPGFSTRFEAHMLKYADINTQRGTGNTLVARANTFLRLLDEQIPGASAAVWRRLLDVPNAELHERASAQLKSMDLMTKPLDLVFTAVDGREVDLKLLRGKVVLIDFWATWCGPCKAELPNVVANYQKYHDKGFEIVGIALENAKLTPQDTPDQIATKILNANKVLTDFTAEHGMPWAQYSDGKFWQNEMAVRYSINAIPAMFLLDQDGKVVSTNARGEALEREIKRLLKL